MHSKKTKAPTLYTITGTNITINRKINGVVNKFFFCSVENQRRTRYFSLTSNPEWNQTMVYPNLQPSDLAKRNLEVTAWNYQPDRPNEYLGEVVLDLSGEFLDS